ncbi:Bug family tripartite tricarboxylate transporter substrate binding protein [Xenophilus azovorans]|uniref:Bug family tripartite tricarboxylate transporter substrate binding protein n=1 Tax=Xenophilus azovorans TaxID=151755 RepID=UPI0009FC0281|nr:tripartite tricarboxylate transporter substrate binding protein [Xenophilus azovorans]
MSFGCLVRRAAAALFSLPVLAGFGPSPAWADTQPWPTRPIRWIVPYTAGGLSDSIARLVAQKLSDRLGQPVVIENKTGAGGNIGTELGAKAAPDGYTIVLGNPGPVTVSQSLYGNLPYAPEKDLAPISLLLAYPNVLIVSPGVPATTLKEFVDYTRAQPHPVAYATAGIGTSLHLAGELFARTTGAKLVHVPYKGGANSRMDLMSGVIPVTFEVISGSLPMFASGKLRPIAVTSAQRSFMLPDVPTVAESGYPGFEVEGWIGVLAPAGTPPEILNRYATEIAAIMRMPDVAAKAKEWGAYVPTLGPDHFGRFIHAESARWREVIRAAGIKVD